MTKEIITICASIAVAVFGSTGFWTWIQSRGKNKSAERKLLLGLAYSEILKRCEYCIRRGYISTEDFNDLNRYLYEPYKALGGNGTAEKLMAEIKSLPTEPKEESNGKD